MVESKQKKPGSINNIQQNDNASFFKRLLQPKLTISQPNDIYEQEADAVAEKVMRMPASENGMSKPFFSPGISSIQRSCAKCEEEEHELQRKENFGKEKNADHELDNYVGNLSSSGQSLPVDVRNFYEPRMGYDFGNVKVHTGSNAAQSAESINALAYTSENNIVFNSGQFAPGTERGKRLLAHELTHVVQQNGLGKPSQQNIKLKIIQADFAVEPTTPGRVVPTLTAAQTQNAITFNRARHTDPAEIALLCGILGTGTTANVIDADFIEAVIRYQAQYGLEMDGKISHKTADMLAKEIIAADAFLGPGNTSNMRAEFVIQTALQTLISANNTTYADYKTAIRGGTMIQQHIALQNQQLLRDINGQLSWNNWARCIELLGRIPPTFNDMTESPVVRATLRRAWTDSNPAVPAVGTTQHEEGGWIYLNLITGLLTTRRAAVGAGASINLDNPPNVTESVTVGTFHTHPNLGAGWTPGPSPTDNTLDTRDGITDIVVGCPTGDVRRTQFFLSGPVKRQHLAGNRGMPGTAGGLAPQAKADGSVDER